LHPTAQGPEDSAAYWLHAADGVRIRIAVWGRAAPGGTVLLFPGRTEYVEKYGRTAADLLARGFATITIDWRGQGLADRLFPDRRLGHVGRFADYQLDVAALVAQARALALPQPWWLLGHSMGGAIGLRAVYEGLPVRAAAFSAPMWGIRMAPAMRPVAWGLSTLSRPLGLGQRLTPGQSAISYLLRGAFAGNSLTSDAEMWSYMKAQLRAVPDLALGGPTLHWLNEALREIAALAGRPAPALPAVTFLGTGESIIDVPPVERRMAAWPGGELVRLFGARHEVLMESPAVRTRLTERLAAQFA
jgi:lysophospholipase